MSDWMLDAHDPARFEIAARAVKLGIAANPDKASHPLGQVVLADGRTVNAHVIHAVDAIIEDGTHIVMINRKQEPGKGKPALPGGFIDPLPDGTVETAIQAAAREAMEEAGITPQNGTLVGTRNLNRPHDIRIATKDLPQYGVAKGDAFMISTQAVHFHVPDLGKVHLNAGDDAEPGSARSVAIDSLTRDSVGIHDHFDMIEAVLPEQFKSWTDIVSKKAVQESSR